MAPSIDPPREISTARLLLRPPILADADGWYQFAREAETMRFLGGVQPRAVAWRAMMTMAGAWALQGFAMFSVIERDTGRWIGRIGPWFPEGWPAPEVGWGLIEAARGRGFAYEAAVASIDWTFSALGWPRVIHCIDPANASSIRLAERLGAAYEGRGQLPPPYDAIEVGIWGQTRAQWEATVGARASDVGRGHDGA